jgi:hypothetical protein
MAALSVLSALLLGAVPGSAAATAAAQVPGPVVLIGTSGLRWTDVDSSTPALSSLLNADSSGWLAIRSVRDTACPVDGWLAVSAGRRAADVPSGPTIKVGESTCRQPTAQIPTTGGPGVVTGWQGYLAEAAAGTYQANPGALAGALAGSSRTTAAVGPGAAIALANAQGEVARAWPGRVDDASGTVDPTILANDVQSALKTNPNLLVVDLGAIRDPSQRAGGEPKPTGAYAHPRADQVQSLDTRLGLVLGELPEAATVIVASLADAGDQPQLQLLAGRGPAPLGGSYGTSLLGSASTRQDGLAQTTDLLPTLLTALSVRVPTDAVGAPLKPVAVGGSPADRLQKLDDIDQASTAVPPIAPLFFSCLVIVQVLLYGGIALMLRGRSPSTHPAAAIGRARMLSLLRRIAVVFACVPAATFLANLLPWWRAGSPSLAVTAAVFAFVIPMAAFALLGPWRTALLGPMGAVGGLTAAVLGVDAATRSHLSMSSLMGEQPVIAGRFYGFSNPAFALFATGALLLAMAVADRLTRFQQARRAGLVVAAIGIVATVIDGAPGLGSDFGGPPAIIPAFALLALFVAGVKVTWRRALLIFAVTIAVLVALSLIDWLRPPGDRTHLGRFVQTAIDGGAWPVIQRKIVQNVHILFGSYLSALLPFGVALVVAVLSRPVAWRVRPLQLAYDRSPVLGQGLIAFGVLMLFGTVLNDSGATVTAVTAPLALPLLVSVSAWAQQLQDSDRLEAAVAGARKAKRKR